MSTLSIGSTDGSWACTMRLQPPRVGDPAGGPADRDGPRGRRGRRRPAHRDGPLVPDGRPGRAARADAGGRTPRSATSPGSPSGCGSAAGHRRRPTATRAAGEDRHHARPALARPRDARHRRGLVRARARGLGVPFPSTAERFERLEETLQVCLRMWGEDDAPYEGTHYRLAETVNVPPPPSGTRRS